MIHETVNYIRILPSFWRNYGLWSCFFIYDYYFSIYNDVQYIMGRMICMNVWYCLKTYQIALVGTHWPARAGSLGKESDSGAWGSGFEWSVLCSLITFVHRLLGPWNGQAKLYKKDTGTNEWSRVRPINQLREFVGCEYVTPKLPLSITRLL